MFYYLYSVYKFAISLVAPTVEYYAKKAYHYPMFLRKTRVKNLYELPYYHKNNKYMLSLYVKKGPRIFENMKAVTDDGVDVTSVIKEYLGVNEDFHHNIPTTTDIIKVPHDSILVEADNYFGNRARFVYKKGETFNFHTMIFRQDKTM